MKRYYQAYEVIDGQGLVSLGFFIMPESAEDAIEKAHIKRCNAKSIWYEAPDGDPGKRLEMVEDLNQTEWICSGVQELQIATILCFDSPQE